MIWYNARMTKINPFRKVFALPLLLVRALKKSKVDNFLGGLLIGSILSLVVNVITVSFQEMVARQQYFEALEHEIVDNYLEANNTIQMIEKNIKEDRLPTSFIFTKRYHANIWESGNALTYLYNLDPKVQFQMAAYYNVGIYRTNRFLDRIENDIHDIEHEYLKCTYVTNDVSACTTEKRVLTESMIDNEE